MPNTEAWIAWFFLGLGPILWTNKRLPLMGAEISLPIFDSSRALDERPSLNMALLLPTWITHLVSMGQGICFREKESVLSSHDERMEYFFITYRKMTSCLLSRSEVVIGLCGRRENWWQIVVGILLKGGALFTTYRRPWNICWRRNAPMWLPEDKTIVLLTQQT